MCFVRNLNLALVFSLAPGSLIAQSYTFQTFAFPTMFKHTANFAGGINNAGSVAGTFQFNPRGGAHVWDRGFVRNPDGTFAPLIIDPSETGHETFAQSINDAGTIVGYYFGADSSYHGYVDIAGSFTTVDALSGPSTEILGINNSGDFVGGTYSTTIGGTLHGFVGHAGVITQIDVPGIPTGTTAYGIDDSGTIVGCAGVGFIRGPLGNFHTFSVAHSSITCPSGVQTSIGTIVGFFQDKSGFEQGFVYKFPPGASSPDPASQGTLTFFSYPNSRSTIPYGVNSQGQIVGFAYVRGVGYISFIATPVAVPTAAASVP